MDGPVKRVMVVDLPGRGGVTFHMAAKYCWKHAENLVDDARPAKKMFSVMMVYSVEAMRAQLDWADVVIFVDPRLGKLADEIRLTHPKVGVHFDSGLSPDDDWQIDMP